MKRTKKKSKTEAYATNMFRFLTEKRAFKVLICCSCWDKAKRNSKQDGTKGVCSVTLHIFMTYTELTISSFIELVRSFYQVILW